MAKEKDFDLGIDNAQFDAGIQQASDFEQSKQLAEDIKNSLETLKSLDFLLQTLCNTLYDLKKDGECLSIDLYNKVRQIRKALTVVIPPETIEHLKSVFQVFCNTFDKMLQKAMNEALTKSEQSFKATEQCIEQQTDRIVKSSKRIALPPMLCYICLALLLYLTSFFGIVWWANANVVHSPQLEGVCYIFTVLIFITTACIIWLYHKM